MSKNLEKIIQAERKAGIKMAGGKMYESSVAV